MKKATIVVLLGTCLVAGCGDDDGAGGGPDAATGEPDASVAVHHHFVTNRGLLPQTSAEAMQYGLDIDGDGTVDNQLGALIGGLQSKLGFTGQDQMDVAITSGFMVLPHSLAADDLVNDSLATWQAYVGQALDSPDFSGSGSFTVDPAGPTDTRLTGAIVGGVFSCGPSEMPLGLTLIEGEPPVTVPLTGARLEATIDAAAATFEGKLGGAVTQDNLNSILLPELAHMRS